MKLRFDRICRFFLILFWMSALPSFPLAAQEGSWSFAASGGIGFLKMENVNQTLESTVRFWNQSEFIPIGPFSKFSQTPLFGVRASYRYERDMAISLSVFFFSSSVRNIYSDPTVKLEMDRSVGSTDILLGLSYFFQLFQNVELQMLVDVGVIMARSEALTFNSRVEKIGPGYATKVYFDTDARYRKTTAALNAGSSVNWYVFSLVFVRAEVLYRYANVGEMDGTVRTINGTLEERSATDFDFSGLSVSVGIGIQFN